MRWKFFWLNWLFLNMFKLYEKIICVHFFCLAELQPYYFAIYHFAGTFRPPQTFQMILIIYSYNIIIKNFVQISYNIYKNQCWKSNIHFYEKKVYIIIWLNLLFTYKINRGGHFPPRRFFITKKAQASKG